MTGVEPGKVYNESCLRTMDRMPNNFIDLVVTSPPYDNLRKYRGFSFEFEKTANSLLRIVKPGGVVVWVVGDSTINRSETGTSFKQALYFKEIGFKIYDTMIFQKHQMPTDPRLRYYQRFEYMFIFSKGKPRTFNPIKDVPTQRRKHKRVDRVGDTLKTRKREYISDTFAIRGNIWEYDTRNMENSHPAPFPEALVEDHVKSWSNKKDLIFDPFAGSGTTLKMAKAHGRRFIGSEISKDYCKIIKTRLKTA